MSAQRTRNWMTIVYPESAPDNWHVILSDECIPAIASPLHDKDLDPTGEPKKAHYHVMLMFAGVKTQDQVFSICKKFGGIQPRPVSNAQSMARYFIHKDNPDKYQYDPEEITNFSGADWSELVKTSRDRYDTLEKIVQFVLQTHTYSYSDLVNHARMTDRRWFEVCCDNTIFLQTFCKSAQWTDSQAKLKEHEEDIKKRFEEFNAKHFGSPDTEPFSD